MAKKKNQATKKREWFNFNTAITLLVILALFVILKQSLTSEVISLEEEGKIILDKLTNGKEIRLLNSNVLVEKEVNKLDQMDYEEVKSMLGIKNDFCIYFEDANENVMKIDDINLGIGSSKIYINGEPCK
jgi:hypothetical protein